MTPPKNSRPLGIERLDKNFQSGTVTYPVYWVDAFDRRIALRGLAWTAENRRAKSFRRLPDRAEKGLSEGVRLLSCCPAGVFLSFFSNAREIVIRLTVSDVEQMAHMPATGMAGAELYFREGTIWFPGGVAKPSLTETTFTSPLWEAGVSKRREFRVYLPLYKRVNAVALGFSRGAKIEPAPAPRGTCPILFYGTSITQGGCANTTGSDFVSQVGRMLDAEVVNLGFSGNGKGEPEMARLIREVDAEMFVLDFLGNADLATLPVVLPEFIRLIREKRPTTPIVIVSSPAYNRSLWNSLTAGTLESKRDTAMRVYLQGKEAGDRNLYFIDGWALLPAGISGAYVDGGHPTSYGFSLMAEHLVPHLTAIRMGRQTLHQKRGKAGGVRQGKKQGIRRASISGETEGP